MCCRNDILQPVRRASADFVVVLGQRIVHLLVVLSQEDIERAGVHLASF